jgi:hypothetical protein
MTGTTLLLLFGAIVVAALIAAWALVQYRREKQTRASLDRELESRLSPTKAAETPITQAGESKPDAPSVIPAAPQLGKLSAPAKPTTKASEPEVAPAKASVVEETAEGPSKKKVPEATAAEEKSESDIRPAHPRATERMTAPHTAVVASRQKPAVRLPEREPLLRRASEHRGSLLISRTLPPEFERARLNHDLRRIAVRRRRNRQIALAAGLVVVLLIPAYFFIPPVHRLLNPYVSWAGIRLGLIPPPKPEELAPPPKDLEVSYSNELEAVGGRITLDGTVSNISQDKTFDKLYAELTLIKKDSQLTETRVVPVTPSKLAPKEGGRYRLDVSASEFIGNRRVRIFSDGKDIPYEYALPAGALKVRSGAGAIKIEVSVPSAAATNPEKKP